MDFLDPRRRRNHRRRLFIGYVLMAVVVGIGTLIILYLSDGYYIDRKTGDLIQNGIVFIDSKPSDAAVYVNDEQQRENTDTRLVLPAGEYSIRIELDGYRHWERTFNLVGGQIHRLVYPLLIPKNLSSTDLKTYRSLPALVTQSLDRRWVLVQLPGQTYQFDLFDLNNREQTASRVTLPSSILSDPSASASLKVVEWSSDNRHVLLQRSFEKTKEFIILDRSNPSQSVNINTALGITPVKVSLRDKHPERIYYLDKSPGVLRSADINTRTISAPLLTSAIDFKSFDNDIILFVTADDVDDKGKVEFRILDESKQYTLKSVKANKHYLLDISRYNRDFYYIAGSAADNMVFVYKNPLDSLKANPRTPVNVTILRFENPQFAAFSINSKFISLQNANKLLTIDLEDHNQYRTTLNHDIARNQQLKWIDGYRLNFIVNSQSYIIDFDGSNEEVLITTEIPYGLLFDRNYDNVFSFQTSQADGSRKALTRTILNLRQ